MTDIPNFHCEIRKIDMRKLENEEQQHSSCVLTCEHDLDGKRNLEENLLTSKDKVRRNLPKDAKTKVRVVTQEKKWTVQMDDYDPERQWNYLFGEGRVYPTTNTVEEKLRNLSSKQITAKISGYRAQDLKNNLFVPTEFVDLENVLDMLKECHMKCFYCKFWVKVLYQHVREPCQWTLERLENNQGHNKSNVVIACLKCNLSRRCMYHERYLFTKQLNVVKLDA